MQTRHKGPEYHRSAAEHHELAAAHHRQASAHYEEKDFARAAHQAQIAYGNTLSSTAQTQVNTMPSTTGTKQ